MIEIRLRDDDVEIETASGCVYAMKRKDLPEIKEAAHVIINLPQISIFQRIHLSIHVPEKI